MGQSPSNNILGSATDGNSVSGGIQGLILQELKIISILLQQGFGITDDDASFMAVPAVTLNPPAPASSPPTL